MEKIRREGYSGVGTGEAVQAVEEVGVPKQMLSRSLRIRISLCSLPGRSRQLQRTLWTSWRSTTVRDFVTWRWSSAFLIKPVQNCLAKHSKRPVKIGTQPEDGMDRA